MNTMI